MSDNKTYREASYRGFKAILNAGGNTTGPVKVVEHVRVIEEKYNEVKIDVCFFEEEVVFDKVQFGGSLHFKDCVFNKRVQFINTTFSLNVHFENCEGNELVEFINCAIDHLKFDSGKYKNIKFSGSITESKIGSNSIKFCKSYIESLKINSKDVFSSIEFNGGVIKDLLISRTKVHSFLLFNEKFLCPQLIFESSEFYERIDFEEADIDFIYLRKTTFNEQVIFRKNFICKRLNFSNTFSKRTVSIDYSEDNIQNLDIDNCNAQGGIVLSGHLEQELNTNNGIALYVSGPFYGFLSVSNISIFPSISAINFGTILFDKIRSKIITIQSFHNYGKLVLSNLFLHNVFNSLIILDSNTRSTEFINVDLREFNEVVIANSNVSELVLSNSFLPSTINTETKEPKLGYKIEAINKIKSDSYKRENYRQLKIAMESQGNRKESLHFKSLEMNYLRRELPFNWDKILLILNYISNNHGKSWTRGVLFTIASAWGFFILYESALPTPHFHWTIYASFGDIQNGFLAGVKFFLKYLALFPSLRFENDGDSGTINLITLLARIFIGYGIYQTITAFRKFGAK